MVILEALEPVFINGVIIEPDQKFSCSVEFADKLIKSKSAKLIEGEINTESIDEAMEPFSKETLESKKKEELLKIAHNITGINESSKKSEIINAILKNGE